MFKRITAVAIAVLMVMSMAVIAASAAEVNDSNVGADSSSAVGADSSSAASGAGEFVYFDAEGWKSFNKIYCHLWEIGGESFYDWQTPAQECTKVSGTIFSYDLSKLKDSNKVSGGLKSGVDYCIIFHSNTGLQTYDTTFGVECKGDTLSLTEEMIENPVDSNKKGYEAVWKNNSGKYGPHLAISSIGNVIGSKLGAHETGIKVIGDWVPTYYMSTNVDAVEALAKAMPQFGIKTTADLTNVYAYVTKKDSVTKSELPDIKKTLEDAFKKAYPSQGNVEIDEEEAEEAAQGDPTQGGSGGGGSSEEGGSSDGGGTYGNSSGSGADGQETTIFFVLAGVMAVAAGAMFISRKKRED